MSYCCFICGREIKTDQRYVSCLVVQVSTNRLGVCRIHHDYCGQATFGRTFIQTVEWSGSLVSNSKALRTLHGRLCASNGSVSFNVPLFIA